MFVVCWLISWLVLQCSFIRRLSVRYVITGRCKWTHTHNSSVRLFILCNFTDGKSLFHFSVKRTNVLIPINFVWLWTFVLKVPQWIYTPVQARLFTVFIIITLPGVYQFIPGLMTLIWFQGHRCVGIINCKLFLRFVSIEVKRYLVLTQIKRSGMVCFVWLVCI